MGVVVELMDGGTVIVLYVKYVNMYVYAVNKSRYECVEYLAKVK